MGGSHLDGGSIGCHVGGPVATPSGRPDLLPKDLAQSHQRRWCPAVCEGEKRCEDAYLARLLLRIMGLT